MHPRCKADHLMLAVALSSTPWRCRLQTVLLFPESAALLLKIARAGEVQLRVEACWALARLVDGTNRAAADAVLKDIFKTVRGLLTDKAVPVQVAAAEVRWSPPSVIGGGGPPRTDDRAQNSRYGALRRSGLRMHADAPGATAIRRPHDGHVGCGGSAECMLQGL